MCPWPAVQAATVPSTEPPLTAVDPLAMAVLTVVPPGATPSSKWRWEMLEAAAAFPPTWATRPKRRPIPVRVAMDEPSWSKARIWTVARRVEVRTWLNCMFPSQSVMPKLLTIGATESAARADAVSTAAQRAAKGRA
ncbi:MAG: hypothetical protein FD126_1916 [Elusimicrobia bacterium]|nr:MAG: hypothetical protein FD126_1916 [Elusimicrobiota bacterium]